MIEYFKILDHRMRNQGGQNDGLKLWDERIRKNTNDQDSVTSYNKHHGLSGVLGGNEGNFNFPLTGLGLQEPIGWLTELLPAVKKDFSIIVVMDGRYTQHQIAN